MSVMDMNSRMAMAEKLSVAQLQQAIQSGSLPAYIGIPLIEQKNKERSQMAAAQGGQQKPPSVASQILQQADQQEQQERGIDELPSNLPMMEDEEMGMAGGGIVAFAERGQVEDPEEDPLITALRQDPLAQFSGLTPETLTADTARIEKIKADRAAAEEKQRRGFLRTAAPHMLPPVVVTTEEPQPSIDSQYVAQDMQEGGRGITAAPGAKLAPSGTPGAPRAAPQGGSPNALPPTPQMTSAAQPESAMDRYARMLEAQGEDSAKARKDAKAMAIIQAGLGMMGGTSPNAFANIAQGAMPAIQSYQQALQGLRKDDRERIGKLIEMGVSKEKLAMELKKLGIEDKKADAMVNLYNARAGAAGSGGGGDAKKQTTYVQATRNYTTAIGNIDNKIAKIKESQFYGMDPAKFPSLAGKIKATNDAVATFEKQKRDISREHQGFIKELGINVPDYENRPASGNDIDLNQFFKKP